MNHDPTIGILAVKTCSKQHFGLQKFFGQNIFGQMYFSLVAERELLFCLIYFFTKHSLEKMCFPPKKK